MIEINLDKCKGCGICEQNCPVGAIVVGHKIVIDELKCVSCGVCVRVCKFETLTLREQVCDEAVKCQSCPVQCEIKPGYHGACRRYVNANGVLVRSRPLVAETVVEVNRKPQLERPLITGARSVKLRWNCGLFGIPVMEFCMTQLLI
jgi:ferredoxin